MARVSTYLNFPGNTEQVFKFWGVDYGSLTDQFGIRWMVNCSSKD
jgi:hypothetical protein